ncbi:EamA family transporter RarD [Vibrio sp. HA2012]|uniref:EamA family transporter RarD n=1 Tax=Vibrio sp. HA2012 TaxID=1971595 RepID=UPI000C2C9D72|nr:EamA family transporter RarD [Vibrio sp. HA2012]PJC84963.1 EamA family transporter RarD [Vibrio sp. HA2012]
MDINESQRSRQGVIFALGAYVMWGIAPIYFKAISIVSAPEILSHRIIWSFFFLALLIHLGRRWKAVRNVLQHRKTMLCLLTTALLVGGNWLLFIWSVNAGHMLEASLGYFINPLINVLFGMLFLQEKLRSLQWFAVILALAGVTIQIIGFGSVPLVSLGLATSFGLYGLLRKKINLDAQTGLFIETLLLLPVAALYLLFIADTPTSDMFKNGTTLNLLLLAAGLVTTLPLLCFNGAATRLKLSTLGFFQYIGPSMMFLLAVFIYGEVFEPEKAITFAFIWAALIVFSLDGLSHHKKSRQLAARTE